MALTEPSQSSDRVNSLFLKCLCLAIQLTKASLVIQGIADVSGKASHDEVAKAVDFTYNAVQGNKSEEHTNTKGHMNGINDDAKAKEWVDVGKDAFSTDEARVLKMVKDTFADYFTVDAYDGLVANLERGSLGLVKAAPGEQKDIKKLVRDHDKIEMKQPVVEQKAVEVAVET